MRVEKIGPDQIINLIWIIGIVIMIIVLLSTRTPTPGQNYLEITGSGITELVDKGQIVREGITVTWHGDTLCNPEELRVAAQRLIEMADAADKLVERLELRLCWKPIKTAPKDGTEVLVFATVHGMEKIVVAHYMPGGYCIEDHPAIDEGWYYCAGGMFDLARKPTHWMPLPEPPQTEVVEGK